MFEKEPIGTLSNVAYLAAAYMIAVATEPNLLLVAALAGVGGASGAFHFGGSVKNSPEHKADEAAVYFVVMALLAHVLGNNVYFLLGAFTVMPFAFMKLDRLKLFVVGPALAGGVLVMLVVQHGFMPTLPVIGFTAAAAVFRFFIEDRVRNAGTKDFIHGIWHALSATAVYMAWGL